MPSTSIQRREQRPQPPRPLHRLLLLVGALALALGIAAAPASAASPAPAGRVDVFGLTNVALVLAVGVGLALVAIFMIIHAVRALSRHDMGGMVKTGLMGVIALAIIGGMLFRIAQGTDQTIDSSLSRGQTASGYEGLLPTSIGSAAGGASVR